MAGPSSSILNFDESEYLPGSLSLFEQLDKKLMVVLRDGRTLIGYLRSLDQFGNLVLHRTVERIHVDKAFGDIPRGIFLIRGENVVLAGEIDVEKEDKAGLEQVSWTQILDRQRDEQEKKKALEDARAKALNQRGLLHSSELDDPF